MSRTLLLIEDHPIVREGCRRLLAGAAFTVSEAGSGEEGLALNRSLAPRFIVLDLNLPDLPGFSALSRLRAENGAAAILVFSMYEERAFVRKALEGGALGYVSKADDPACLLEGLETIGRGERYLAPRLARKLALSALGGEEDGLARLSARERELLALLAEGRTLAEIALHLGLSYRSAAHIAAQLRQKLNLRTQAALIKFAIETRAFG
jgi:two-component system invasion response regulator UvrY